MTTREVPNELTALHELGLASAIPFGWRQLFGAPPARDSVLCLVAQIRHETGLVSCHNWNIGNFKSAPGDGRSWTYFRCWERNAKGEKVWYDPPNPTTRFRAYDSLEESMVDYLAVLRNRYSAAWTDVLAGDPAEFCKALKAMGYFSDTEAVYEHDVVSAFKRYQTTLQFDLDPSISPELAARAEMLREVNLAELAAALTIPAPAPRDDEDLGPSTPEDRPTRPDDAPVS